MTTPQPIFILDELELMPGTLDAFLATFERDYRPAAEARGMKLQHTWVTPPVEIADKSPTVVLVWALDGVGGFWGARAQNAQEEIAAWWAGCRDIVLSRSRRYAAESSDLPALAAAGKGIA
jgi:hypothetical protein